MPEKELTKKLDKNFLLFREDLESLILNSLNKSLAILEMALDIVDHSVKAEFSAKDLLLTLSDLDKLVQSLTDEIFVSEEWLSGTDLLKSYNTRLEKDLSEEEKIIRKIQAEERIYPQEGDVQHVKLGKYIKRLHYRGRKILNHKYKLFQNILHWQIIRYVYRNRMQEGLLAVLEQILPRSSALHAEIREMVENIEKSYLSNLLGELYSGGISIIPAIEMNSWKPQISNKIKSLVKDLNQGILDLRIKMDNEYDLLKSIGGTLEFPDSRLRPGRINKNYKSLLLRLQEQFTGWSRNHWFIYEDWRFDRKILSIVLDVFRDYIKISGIYSDRVRGGIQKYFDEQVGLADEFTAAIQGTQLNQRQLGALYRNLKHRSSSILIRQISLIQRAGLARELRGISINLSELARKNGNIRTVARSFQPDKLVRERDILEVNPMQLIEIEIVPRLASRLKELIEKFVSQTEQITGQMMQYSSIIDFGIASAISIPRNHDKNPEEVKKAILEGFSRAADKIEEANEIIVGMDDLVLGEIEGAINSECGKLLELMDNESFLALSLKLAKARTLQTVRKRSRYFGMFLKVMGKAPVRGLEILYQGSSKFVSDMRRKIGYSDQPFHISTELSDFLSRTDAVFNTLPYVYQRLYYIEPIEDDLFFVEREKVMDQINLALKNWQDNGYSPLILVGEKGSGATSVFNIFQNRTKDHTFFRIQTHEQNYDEASFIQKVCLEVGLDPKGDFEKLKEHLNNLPEPTVIILEDLQRYYLRTVHGFTVLKKIFELISSTSQNILWLSSCTAYAWKYLERVLSIASYFGFVVTLNDMKDEDIFNVIEQRHKISGFQIYYSANKVQEKNRKLMRLPEEEKQKYLADSYRQAFYRFARGNISLALVHWIRSTSEIKDKTVVISSIYEPESLFFDSLPVGKILTIYMILIHDGLSEQHLSEILFRSPEAVRNILFQLFDDGLLVRNNGIYQLNPLIYRPAVNFLKLKNYLH